MARLIELLVFINAVAGIATFLGLRFVWRRSKNAAKRGIDVIHADKEECPFCELNVPQDEMYYHVIDEHPEEIKKAEELWNQRRSLSAKNSGRWQPSEMESLPLPPPSSSSQS